MRSRIGIIGLLAAACVGTAAVPPTYAADPVGGISIMRNEQTGLCLDSDMNGNVYTKTCTSNNPYQQWSPISQKIDDYPGYMIKNNRTGLCLTAVDPGNVRTLPCGTGYMPQNWRRGWFLNSNALATSAWNTYTVLDSNSKGNVYLKEEINGNRYQSWLFFKV
ncbi:RICIN domain-containing protein [Streptomyces sp. enrichment culture]|uniref:RICIN domain-containing protein n=1 Tax=Streptomyces sp. enrichment culture TaxID=1795815 RepID=UPI003F55F17D